ncbi:MAG: 3-methyladenine DNA glycosylase AlkC [Neolewinella sp.]|jgi:3-methyladenine DNA glycosylase AlkC
MAEAFKEWIGTELVRTMAKHLRRVHAAFPRERFVKVATAGLAELELKARVVHVADALAATLPSSFSQAAKVLEQSLAPARSDTDLSKLVPCDAGLAGWAVWPMTDYVARYGIKHPKRALRCLHACTQRNTAEYAIRPFLIEHRELTMATLQGWLRDSNPHVRRLVSEGTRPRLPWGIQLQHLVADPTPTFGFLQKLQDDDSEYVRRSVANHLNDIAKDHPGHVAEWLEQNLPGASVERRAMLRHASRTLIKRGDGRVLKAWGLANPLRGEVLFSISPNSVAQGDAVMLSVSLQSGAKKAQALMVDYVVHHVKKSGATSAKTWKGWQLTLQAGEQRELQKKHSLKVVTTRCDYPGKHVVDLMINGKVVASAAFGLTM